MQTVLMAVAIVKDGERVLLRKMNPERNPYQESWALFGGRIEGDGSVTELLNKELSARWRLEITIDERLWWDEEIKKDHDGEEKRFVYIDAICRVTGGDPTPGESEQFEWVEAENLFDYELNPPTKIVLERLYMKDRLDVKDVA